MAWIPRDYNIIRDYEEHHPSRENSTNKEKVLGITRLVLGRNQSLWLQQEISNGKKYEILDLGCKELYQITIFRCIS